MNQTALPCFDDLLALASRHPEQLELLRTRLTQEILDSTNDQDMRQRLEQLVFRINAERCRHTHPMALCIRFSSLMHDGLYHMKHELEKLVATTNAAPRRHHPVPTSARSKHQGQVIQLASYRRPEA